MFSLMLLIFTVLYIVFCLSWHAEKSRLVFPQQLPFPPLCFMASWGTSWNKEVEPLVASSQKGARLDETRKKANLDDATQPASLSVEDMSLAMVREYLARRGYKQTLQTLYGELTTTPAPTSTNIIAAQLGITPLVKANKSKETPLKTLVEIVTAHLLDLKNTGGQPLPIDDGEESKPKKSKSKKKGKKSSRTSNSVQSPEKGTSSNAWASSMQPSVAAPSPTPLGEINGRSGAAAGRQRTQRAALGPGKAESSGDVLEFQDLDDEEDADSLNNSTSMARSYEDLLALQERGDALHGLGLDPGDDSKDNTSLPLAPKDVTRRPITVQEAYDVRSLLFGKSSRLGTFNESWLQQDFVFETRAGLDWGLVQHEGGPCGLLAVVQAYILHFMLHKERDREAALVESLCHILWRAGSSRKCLLALDSMRGTSLRGSKRDPIGTATRIAAGTYHSDGVTEELMLYEFSSYNSLVLFIKSHYAVVASADTGGAIRLLISVVLSRGCEVVHQDMDVSSSALIGDFGYCTQEMVNLLVTGTALSNVFDGTKQLGSTSLRGMSHTAEVGLLSIHEVNGHSAVGECLKRPKYPLWLAYYESHYTLLYAPSTSAGAPSHPAGRTFDLCYYDQLARQEEPIRLTIDQTPDDPNDLDPEVDAVVPPLNYLIRTKWPGARVDWNGSEQLL